MANEYNIYKGQDGEIDYETIVATMDLTDTEVEIPAQALPAGTIWGYARKRKTADCALLSEPSDVCMVRIDGDGEMILSAPNEPAGLAVEQEAGAKLRLRWRYATQGQEVAATGFRIYQDSGAGFDFDTPTATVTAYGAGEYSWLSATLTGGQRYKYCVRAYRTGGGETQNTDYVSARAVGTGPAAAAGLYATQEDA